MYKLLFILGLFACLNGYSQNFPQGKPYVSSTTAWLKQGYLESRAFIFTLTDTFPAALPTLIRHFNGKYYHTMGNGAAWSEFISGSGVSSGVSSFNSRSGAVVSQFSDYSSWFVPLARTITINGVSHDLTSNASYTVSAGSVSFSSITSKPTTLSGYGITDAYSSSNPSNFINNTQAAATVRDSLQANTLTLDGNDFVNSGGVTSLRVRIISGSTTLDFPSTAAQSSSDLLVSVTGAVNGDAVAIGVPNELMANASNFTAWVSTSNTVTVRFNNYSPSAIDPSSGVIQVKVFK